MRPRLLDHHRRLILVNFSVLFGFWSSQGTTQLQPAEAGAQQTSCCCSAIVLVLVLLQLGMKQGIKSRQCKVCGWRLFLDWITFNPVSYASVLYPLVWCLTCCVGTGGLPGWPSRSSLYLYGRALNSQWIPETQPKKISKVETYTYIEYIVWCPKMDFLQWKSGTRKQP